MLSMKTPILCNGLTAVLLSATGIAPAADVHQHGRAEAAVVLEGKALTVSFRAPLMDILGTEQPPVDAPARRRYDQRLADITPPVPSSEAGCDLEEATLSNVDTLFPEAAGDHHAHAHDHEDKPDTHGHHVDVENEWIFVCQSPADLQAVSLPFLNTFSGLTTEVILLLPGGQNALRLAPGDTRIPLE